VSGHQNLLDDHTRHTTMALDLQYGVIMYLT